MIGEEITLTRLGTVAKDIADALQHASANEHYAVISIACRAAHAEVELDNTTIEESYYRLLSGEMVSDDDLAKLENIADAYDSKYLQSQSKGDDPSVWYPTFRIARFVSCLALAFRQRLSEGADEVLYEASSVFENPEPLLNDVRSSLDLPLS